MTANRTTQPQGPTGDRATGYSEKQPRDREDVKQPDPPPTPDPDEGGLDRGPESTPGD